MLSIVFFKEFFGRLAHLKTNQFKASLLKLKHDFVDKTSLDSIRFYHDEGALSTRRRSCFSCLVLGLAAARR